MDGLGIPALSLVMFRGSKNGYRLSARPYSRISAMRVALVALCLAATVSTSSAPLFAQTFRAESSGPIGFGGSAAIVGDQVLIGRPGTLIGFPMPPSHAGAVHVFRRDGER